MTQEKITLNSPSVQSYLTILQGVIDRMGTNSASVKTWCIALVSAIVVIIADKGIPGYVWVSILPIVLFFYLDSYYLGLERSFRNLYNEFIRKLHSNTVTVQDVFIVTPTAGLKDTLKSSARAIFSLSVWPFYGLLLLMLVVVKIWVL